MGASMTQLEGSLGIEIRPRFNAADWTYYIRMGRPLVVWCETNARMLLSTGCR